MGLHRHWQTDRVTQPFRCSILWHRVYRRGVQMMDREKLYEHTPQAVVLTPI